MLKAQTKGGSLLWSGISFLLASGLAAPAHSFAQQNDANAAAFQSNLSAPLNSLNDVQKTYAQVPGAVSQMHQYGLVPRQKAAQALEQIRSGVLQARNSDKIPPDLLKSALIAIDEAQTALKTDSAQTIAWSLQTVGIEVRDVQAKLTGQNPPAETASQERPTGTGGGTRAPDQASDAAAPEQKQARVAEAEHRTGVTPQTPQAPNSNVETRVKNERSQNGPMQQAAPEQPMQQSAQAQPPAQQPAQPAQQPSNTNQPNTASNQPSTQPNAVASMKRDKVIGEYLYDKNGDNVAKIQDVKTSSDGKIQAVEIDVGGFLGIGSRRIAVPVDSLQKKGDRIESTSMTSDQIRNLPHEAK